MLSSVVRLTALLVAAIIGGIIAVWFTRAPAPPPATPTATFASAPVAESVEVTQMPAAARVELGGHVEPRTVIRLSAQAPGRVVYLAGQEGDRVAAGQLVAALDTDALQAQYRAAWGNLASEQAASVNAETQLYHRLYGQPTTSPMGGPAYDAYERGFTPFYNMAQGFMNMMPGGGGPFSGPGGYGSAVGPTQTQQQQQRSFPAISNARTDYERQQAALLGSQARIDQLDAALRDRRSISTRAGVILKRYVRVGDIVQPGQPIADIGDVDQLDVVVEVPVAQVSQVKLGDSVPVTVNGRNIWTTVSQIYPAASADQHTVTVKFALPDGVAAAPGMYARVWIAQAGGVTPSTLAPAIPTKAIVYRGSLPVAFVVTGHGVEMRVLRLGDTMGDRTAVLAGLSAGERVLANPSPDLKSGESASGQAP